MYSNYYYYYCIMGAFAKFRKATIGFFKSLSDRPMEQLGSHWADFHKIWYLNIFRKPVGKIQISLKSVKNDRYVTCRPIYVFLIISRSFRFRMIFQTKLVETIKTHILCSIIFFPKIVPFTRWDNVEKYCRSVQDTDDNIARTGYLRLQTHTEDM